MNFDDWFIVGFLVVMVGALSLRAYYKRQAWDKDAPKGGVRRP